MKRIKKIVALLLIVSMIGLTGGSNIVYAQTDTLTEKHIEIGNDKQWGEKHCPGKDTCYGCSANDCDVYKVQDLSVSFTASECRKVANKASGISTWGGLSTIAASFVAPIPGAIAGVYTIAVGNAYKMFEKAADKGKGLTFECEYVISKTSYSLNRYRKGTVYYTN